MNKNKNKNKNKEGSGSGSSDLRMADRGGVDRISNLPDTIIHHILSFLDTRSAVQTSLLSKQWKSAWKHVHALNLELKFAGYFRCGKFVHTFLSRRHPLHVSKVLWHRNSDARIEDAPSDCEFGMLRKVVQYAVSHGAQQFDLRPNKYESNISLHKLFDGLITDTVTSLELQWFDINCRHECSLFRLLTTIKLQSCYFLTDGLLVEPFSQFPCLKDLGLLDCSWLISKDNNDDDPPATLRVSGLELDRLSLSGIRVWKSHFGAGAWKLEIFAPKLKSYGLYFEACMRLSELTVPSLLCADIQSKIWNFFSKDYPAVVKNLVLLFNGLHNVESLTLCDDMSEAVVRISRFLERQPSPFKQLKKLILEYVSLGQIPYQILDNYFFNGYPITGLNIRIQKKRLWQVTIQRFP